jgi:hypothetical protein
MRPLFETPPDSRALRHVTFGPSRYGPRCSLAGARCEEPSENRARELLNPACQRFLIVEARHVEEDRSVVGCDVGQNECAGRAALADLSNGCLVLCDRGRGEGRPRSDVKWSVMAFLFAAPAEPANASPSVASVVEILTAEGVAGSCFLRGSPAPYCARHGT